MKIRLLFLMLLAACVNHDFGNPLKQVALEAACNSCGKTVAEMFWFEELVDKIDREETWKGNIYTGSLDGSVIFIHQPFASSCVACHVYDCEGNRLTLTQQQVEIVIDQMNESNQIYNGFAAD